MDQIWAWMETITGWLKIVIVLACLFGYWMIWWDLVKPDGGGKPGNNNGGGGGGSATDWAQALRASVAVTASGVVAWMAIELIPRLIPALSGSVQTSLGL